MYRTLLPIFVCLSAVHTAPQEASGKITNVKLTPITDTLNSTKESGVENLPSISYSDEKNEKDGAKNKGTDEGDSTRYNEDTTRSDENVKRVPILHSDSGSEEDGTIQTSNSEGNSTRNNEDDDRRNISEKRKINEENQRTIRSNVTTVNYESETTAATERDVIDDIVDETDDYESRTKAPTPRFLSKLSYFQKNEYSSPVLTNLVEIPGRRSFKSKCRCEKIWNCPKLQITVPRCPNEYFLCCF